jgi:hypothetical protein
MGALGFVAGDLAGFGNHFHGVSLRYAVRKGVIGAWPVRLKPASAADVIRRAGGSAVSWR